MEDVAFFALELRQDLSIVQRSEAMGIFAWEWPNQIKTSALFFNIVDYLHFVVTWGVDSIWDDKLERAHIHVAHQKEV